MLTLPFDIQLGVLDLITDHYTLSTLCLVCKEARDLASPRLYSHLSVDLTRFATMMRLEHSIGNGAGAAMQRHTRRLTFVDHRPNTDAIAVRPVQFTTISNATMDEFGGVIGERNGPTPSERDHWSYLVLALVTKDALISLRFLSERPISSRMLEHIFHYQSQLRHFQAPIQHDLKYRPRFVKYPLSDIPDRFAHLETLDVHFLCTEQFRDFISNLAWANIHQPCLRRLRISVFANQSVAFSETFRKAVARRQPGQDARLAKVEQLTLAGFDLAELFSSIALIIRTRALTHLTLWNCSNANNFVEELASTFSMQQLDLRHLAVMFRGISCQDIDICLEDMFKICCLKSLHITWHSVLHGCPSATLASIARMGSTLQSLSLHDKRMVDLDNDNVQYLYPDFGKQLSSCVNLQQLGLQVEECFLDPALWDCTDVINQIWGSMYKQGQFWSELQYLPKLRVLHLRQKTISLYHHNQEGQCERGISWSLQRFVGGLFAYLSEHALCPDLRVIVIRMRRRTMFDRFSSCAPQHCFARGLQKGPLNTERVIAIPVSYSAVREIEPNSDILQMDPGCEQHGDIVGQFSEATFVE